jgi:hypothetical protein
VFDPRSTQWKKRPISIQRSAKRDSVPVLETLIIPRILDVQQLSDGAN